MIKVLNAAFICESFVWSSGGAWCCKFDNRSLVWQGSHHQPGTGMRRGPLFVKPPPKVQRVLHSEAYLRYIEGKPSPYYMLFSDSLPALVALATWTYYQCGIPIASHLFHSIELPLEKSILCNYCFHRRHFIE